MACPFCHRPVVNNPVKLPSGDIAHEPCRRSNGPVVVKRKLPEAVPWEPAVPRKRRA